MPITIDKIEVRLDFHIYDILDFDLFLGLPLEKLLASHGSLDEKLRKVASATATPCLENLLAKPLPEHNPLEEIMHTSPFISSEPVLLKSAKSATSEEYDSEDTLHLCEDERSSSPSIEFEPLPAGPEYVIPDLSVSGITSICGGGDSRDPTTNEQVVAPEQSLNQLQMVIDLCWWQGST